MSDAAASERPCTSAAEDAASAPGPSGAQSTEQSDVLPRDRDAANAWNLSHDTVRVLPTELREQCWIHLPMADVCNLAAVCSTWRDLSRNLAALWTDIDFPRPSIHLAQVLSRSRDLLVKIALHPGTFVDLAFMDVCIRPHAHRLRTLILNLGTDVDSMQYPDGKSVLGYPMAQLRSLTIFQFWRRPFELFVPSGLFDGCAPQLRSFKVLGLGLPSLCPALRYVSTVMIEEDPRALEHLFCIMPLVEFLSVTLVKDFEKLPPVPPGSPLEKVQITGAPPPFEKLHSLGYTRVKELDIWVFEMSSILSDAASYAGDFATCLLDLSLWPSLYMERSDGCVTRISTHGLHGPGAAQQILGDASAFNAVELLVLPARFSEDHALALLSGELVFPGIHTLVILFASSATPKAHSLLDPDIACASIRLPNIKRLELGQEPGPERGVERVSAQHLAKFIIGRVQPDDPRCLEIVIDPESDISLHAEDIDGAALDPLLETFPTLRCLLDEHPVIIESLRFPEKSVREVALLLPDRNFRVSIWSLPST